MPAADNDRTGSSGTGIAVFVDVQIRRHAVAHPTFMRFIRARTVRARAIDAPIATRRPAAHVTAIWPLVAVRHPRAVPERAYRCIVQRHKLAVVRAFPERCVVDLPLVALLKNIPAITLDRPCRFTVGKLRCIIAGCRLRFEFELRIYQRAFVVITVW